MYFPTNADSSGCETKSVEYGNSTTNDESSIRDSIDCVREYAVIGSYINLIIDRKVR